MIQQAKLSEEQIIEIQKLYATGKYSLRELGNQFGVSNHCIRYHVNPQVVEKANEYTQKINIRNIYKEIEHYEYRAQLDMEFLNNIFM